MHHCCLLEAPKHAKDLGQSSYSPLAVYMCKEGALRYPTNAELSKQIKGMATAAHICISLQKNMYSSPGTFCRKGQ
jgi:hypothetical protein